MKREEIVKKLDRELERILKEIPDIHVTEARKQAIENLNLTIVNPYTKKGYVEPKNCIKWGSKVGYDNEYFVGGFTDEN